MATTNGAARAWRGLPPSAAWTHAGSGRRGFEATTIAAGSDGCSFRGTTTAIENDVVWTVTYEIDLDPRGVTRRADVTRRVGGAIGRTVLEHDGGGRWTVDGAPAPALDGCLDVDLESSAVTNAFPVRRLEPTGPASARSVPAAFVRVASAVVERLEQRYRRIPTDASAPLAVEYAAPAFDVRCRITYDAGGLVLDYPGIATRTFP